MGYFQVRYDSRVINYDRRGFIRLSTGLESHISGDWKQMHLVVLFLTKDQQFLPCSSSFLFIKYRVDRVNDSSWSSLVERDEVCIGPSSKLLCLRQPQKII